MITIRSLKDIPLLPSPIALTIGTFDGVHLGHQHILQEIKKHGTSVVLTFSNHPAEILHTHKPLPLCSEEEKLKLLENFGIDCVIVIPFTRELADQPYDLFLKNLRKHLPFTTLVLGKNASFGHRNAGDETHIKAIEADLGFQAIYLEKFVFDGAPVSSKRIRELLAAGQDKQASALFGHQRKL